MKKNRLVLTVLVWIICAHAGHAWSDASPLKLSLPEKNWYPFLYKSDSTSPKGLMYDIVAKALTELDIKFETTPLSVKRVVLYARTGDSDAVILGFRPEWDAFLDYPPQAGASIESPWRIMQVDDVLVTVASDPYEFQGRLATLPPPVRILREDPIKDRLKGLGIYTEEVKEDIQNFYKLIRDKNGGVITSSIIAEQMNRNQRFKNRIKIHSIPVSSKSYYLAFSKKSRVSQEHKTQIWKEIIRWRDDYIFMMKILSRY